MVGAASRMENKGRGETMDELSSMHHAMLLEYSGGRGDIIRMIMARTEHRDGGAIADENGDT